MPEDFYVLLITALLPVSACSLVLQVNPYHALVIRGILGAVAALVYALLGAADVALTEALVGTMLSITLYAVAVRSSLSMRMGVLDHGINTLSKGHFGISSSLSPENIDALESGHASEAMLSALRKMLGQHYMRLELVSYTNLQALQSALIAKDIHTTCVASEVGGAGELPPFPSAAGQPPYHLETRVRRLYELMQAELPSELTSLSYLNPTNLSPADVRFSGPGLPDPAEAKL